VLDLPDILSAYDRLGPFVAHTAPVSSAEIDAAVGGHVILKLECLQRAGSFKVRGALSAMTALPTDALRRGVVAPSSGNHALAVALAAHLLDTSALVVLPHDGPPVKRDAASRLGARIRLYNRFVESRDALVAALARDEGRAPIPSSNSALVMAGAGTVALELLRDAGRIDLLVVPVGGGGLAAGCAVAAAALSPSTRVVGVEPAGGDDTRRSLRAGRRTRVAPPLTIADGLRHQIPEELTFRINRRLLSEVVTVSDAEIVAAMRLLHNTLGVPVEPSGACALAALYGNRVRRRPTDRVGVVVSGGNIDAHELRTLLDGRAETAPSTVRAG